MESSILPKGHNYREQTENILMTRNAFLLCY